MLAIDLTPDQDAELLQWVKTWLKEKGIEVRQQTSRPERSPKPKSRSAGRPISYVSPTLRRELNEQEWQHLLSLSWDFGLAPFVRLLYEKRLTGVKDDDVNGRQYVARSKAILLSMDFKQKRLWFTCYHVPEGNPITGPFKVFLV